MTLVKLINQHISVFSSITWGQPHPWCYRCNLTHVEPWDQPWLCPSCPVALLLPGGTSKPPLQKRWTHLGIYAGTLDSGSNGHILSRHHLDLGRQEAKTWGEGALCQGSRDLGLGSPAPQFSHMTNGLPLPPPRACWRSVMLIASSSWSELIKCHSIQLLSASSNASAEPGGLGTSSPAPQSLEPGSPSRASELRFPDCNLQEMAGTAGCQQATGSQATSKGKNSCQRKPGCGCQAPPAPSDRAASKSSVALQSQPHPRQPHTWEMHWPGPGSTFSDSTRLLLLQPSSPTTVKQTGSETLKGFPRPENVPDSQSPPSFPTPSWLTLG